MIEPARPSPSEPTSESAGRHATKKLVQLWVLDPRTPGLQAEIDRHLRASGSMPEELDVMDWVEAATADLDLEPYTAVGDGGDFPPGQS